MHDNGIIIILFEDSDRKEMLKMKRTKIQLRNRDTFLLSDKKWHEKQYNKP